MGRKKEIKINIIKKNHTKKRNNEVDPKEASNKNKVNMAEFRRISVSHRERTSPHARVFLVGVGM